MNTLSNSLSVVNAAVEIIRLHGEILTAARTSLDNAFRIGELLIQEKARLAHGQWLPWLKSNVPFSDHTARNYIRCFENRGRLKLESVSNLAEAYRLLAPPPARPAAAAEKSTSPHMIPPAGRMLSAENEIRGWYYLAQIAPSNHAGYYFLSLMSHDTRRENSGATMDFTKKAIHQSAIERFLDILFCARVHDWRTAMRWSAFECEPWTYNEDGIYGSHDAYMREEVLGL